jgi:signal transduction histidine kinase
MGLAIAKGIVEAHEGKIWIESGSDGVGTRVVFTLPIGDDEIVASVPEAETSNERKRPYSGSR